MSRKQHYSETQIEAQELLDLILFEFDTLGIKPSQTSDRTVIPRTTTNHHQSPRLNIYSVTEKEITELNKKYIGKDNPTDVLSFPYTNGTGDIIICKSQIKKGRLIETITHGALHIYGFEHGKNMFEIQDQICEKVQSKVEPNHEDI